MSNLANLQRGRQLGQQNKLTKSIKRIITDMLEMVSREDIFNLYTYCMKNKRDFLLFMSKIAPKLLVVQGDIQHNVEIDKAKAEDLYNIIVETETESISPNETNQCNTASKAPELRVKTINTHEDNPDN